MARYVIVEFDSNEQAESFVRKMMATGSLTYRVRWMFAKPEKWCDCEGYEDRGRTGKARLSSRGMKFGWWVHRECRRPHRLTTQTPANLLDPEAAEMPAATRRMAGWTFSPWQCETKLPHLEGVV